MAQFDPTPARAKGGYLIHLLPVTGNAALCGHAPKPNSRSGWCDDGLPPGPGRLLCDRCVDRLDQRGRAWLRRLGAIERVSDGQ